MPDFERPSHFPVLWPREYESHALSCGAGEALFRAGNFSDEEKLPDADSLADPVGETALSPVPFLYRKYPDRVLFTATSRCFFYCRFCFRRANPPGPEREPDVGDISRAALYVAQNAEIEEVILSGGDPLTLPDSEIASLLRVFGEIESVKRLRIHTRAPVVMPSRIDARLLEILRGAPKPFRAVIHCIHPAELRPEMEMALKKLSDSGIPLGNQSVLCGGINDSPETLDSLFSSLHRLGVSPHYLHHPDRAPGNGHFRLSIERGLSIFRAYEKIASSPKPRYVVDLPDGSGKVETARLEAIATQTNGGRRRTLYRAPGGVEFWDIWTVI